MYVSISTTSYYLMIQVAHSVSVRRLSNMILNPGKEIDGVQSSKRKLQFEGHTNRK